MNIFYTNKCPKQAAREHCKVHTRKMIVEYAQLLSTAHHVLDEEPLEGIYKLTHKNHPSAIWVREDILHYQWTLNCALELCRIYHKYSGKEHATLAKLELLKQHPKSIPCKCFKEPPVAAPDKFRAIKIFEGSCKAYQQYLRSKFEEWQSRDKPIKVEFYEEVPYWLSSK